MSRQNLNFLLSLSGVLSCSLERIQRLPRLQKHTVGFALDAARQPLAKNFHIMSELLKILRMRERFSIAFGTPKTEIFFQRTQGIRKELLEPVGNLQAFPATLGVTPDSLIQLVSIHALFSPCTSLAFRK